MLLYHDFTQFLDDIVQSWVCLVNIEKRLLFNVKQEQFAVFGNLMFPKIPVMYDPSRYNMLFVLVTFKAVITGIVCANFELSINHAYKTNRQIFFTRISTAALIELNFHASDAALNWGGAYSSKYGIRCKYFSVSD